MYHMMQYGWAVACKAHLKFQIYSTFVHVDSANIPTNAGAERALFSVTHKEACFQMTLQLQTLDSTPMLR